MRTASEILPLLTGLDWPCGPAEKLRHQVLPGEADLNVRLDRPDGTAFLLKCSLPDAFEAGPVLEHLYESGPELQLPRLLGSQVVDTAGGPRRLQLFSWVPGREIDTLRPRTAALRRSWGRAAGQLSRALASLRYPAARRAYRWDPLRYTDARALLSYLPAARRPVVEDELRRLDELDFSRLPRQVNYNDAHESNLLSADGREVTGVVDFGDVVYTARACEPAIAAAYAAMGAADPLGALREVVEGFTVEQPLTNAELDVLPDLLRARLLLTVTAAAERRQREPDNAYLTVSEAAAWELLDKLRGIPAGLLRATVRVAAGRPAHPLADRYAAWAATARNHPVMDLPGPTPALDLSVGSPVLGLNRNFEELPRFVRRLRRWLEDAGAPAAVGGYGEVRPVYTTDDFQSEGNYGPRWRSVHLGLDVWTPHAGAPVYAPLDGRVHSCGIDPTANGYGPTILLEHAPAPGLTFYTLYGHLSREALRELRAGTQVQGGAQIATLGAPDENGGWPPHLHFQVMLDVLDLVADYPGVAYPEERDVWLGLCPDPRTLLPNALPAEHPAPPAAAEVHDRRRVHLGYGLSVSYRQPLHVLRGARQYLYDHTGRRYLDTVNNVAHVGHEHPRVVTALQRQAAVLNTNTRYLHSTVVELAERLTRLLPDPLSVVHFTNSGSEANELALRMAEAVTGSRRVLAMEMGYHGNTDRTIAVSSYKFDRPGGRGAPAETLLLPLPDPLRGRNLVPDVPQDGPLTFIAESIMSCGGQLPLPDGYLRRVYAAVRERGGVTIADEVQTGLGRVGTHHWAFELQGVVPDIVTVGKPFGNGHPIGAVICTPPVAVAFNNGMEYFNTFGGNPVSAAVGLEVLRVLEEEGLRENALATGAYLTEGLRALQADFPIVADVRGAGLFLGAELLGADSAPAPRRAAYVKNRMRELGILISTDGPYNNIIKVKPPLCFSRANADMLLHYLARVLREDGARIA